MRQIDFVLQLKEPNQNKLMVHYCVLNQAWPDYNPTCEWPSLATPRTSGPKQTTIQPSGTIRFDITAPEEEDSGN